jgi:hypothetical protein
VPVYETRADRLGYGRDYTPVELDLELHTGMSLLWLGDPKEAAPPGLRSPPDQAQAQINLALCLAYQNEPDEGIRLVAEAFRDSAGREANLRQASEFLGVLKPTHRNLPAAQALAEQLRALHASRPG